MKHVIVVLYVIGQPWWVKQILNKFGLYHRFNTGPVVLKNTPYVNERLSEVKHLLRIRPLTFPHGFPTDPKDCEDAVLKSNGEFLIKGRIGTPRRIKEKETHPRAKWQMEDETIKKDCEMRKQHHRIHEEYHKPYYEYTKNQDGKE